MWVVVFWAGDGGPFSEDHDEVVFGGVLWVYIYEFVVEVSIAVTNSMWEDNCQDSNNWETGSLDVLAWGKGDMIDTKIFRSC